MKKVIPIFDINIVKGKIKMSGPERQAMDRWCSTFKTGSNLSLKIWKYSEKVSNPQRAYYRGVVVPILSDHFGYDPEDMNSALKLRFNPIKCKITDNTIGGTTTKMSTEEFFSKEDSFVNRICRWAATEHQIYIPPPKKAE